MQFLRANTQIKVVIGPAVAVGDGFTPVASLDLSTADEAELLKHDAASVTDISGATFAAITSADGYYNLTLTTSHTDTEGLLTVLINDDSLILPIRHTFMVLAEAAYDSMFVAKDDGFMDVNIKTIGRADTQETEASNLESACANYSATRGLAGTALPAAAADGAGGLPISDAGGLDLDALNSNVSAILTDTGTTLDGKIDTIDSIVDTINTTTATLQTLFSGLVFYQGTIGSTGNDTTHVNIDLPAGLGDDQINGLTIVLYDLSAGTYHTRHITDWVASTELATLDSALPASPENATDLYWILSLDLGRIYTRLGAPAGASMSADIAAIEAQTDDIGTAGAGLSAIPWNAAWDADVQSEVADALAVYDPPTKSELDNSEANILYILRGLVMEQSILIGDTGNDTTHVHVNLWGYGDDEINDHLLTIYDNSAGEWHSRWITDWVNSTRLVTLDSALPFTPENNTDQVWLLSVKRSGYSLSSTQTFNLTGSITGNLSGSVGSVTAGVSLADDAITAAKFDESTAFPVTSADSSSTRIARTGADSDTLETLSDQIDGLSTAAAPQLLQNTTIATLSTQTSFTLTAGSADDDAYNGAVIIVTDQSTATQKAVGIISDYVGSTKGVTLSADPGIFTMAAGDTVDILANITSAPTVTQIRQEMDSNSTQLAAIVADTNELQTDWANGGRLDLILDARASQTTADAIETDTQNIQSRLPTSLVSGRMDSNMQAAANDVITAAVIANGAIDAATFAADVDAEILSYLVDDATRIDGSALNTATTSTIPSIANDTTEIHTHITGLVSSHAVIGSTGNDTTHLHLDTLPYGDDEINGLVLAFEDNTTGLVYTRHITDWVASTRLATLDSALPVTPQAGVDYYWLLTVDLGRIYTRIGAAGAGLTAIPWNASWDVEVQSECADALSAFSWSSITISAVSGSVGSVSGSVGSIAGTITTLDLLYTAIYAARNDFKATGFSTHSAADVWSVATRTLTALDEDSTTLDLDATIRAAVGLASANLDTQLSTIDTVADAILDDTGNSGVVVDAGSKTGYALTSAYDFAKGTTAMTEAYAANGAAPTPVEALFAIHQYLMGFSISGTSYTVKKLDESTTAYIVTLNDGSTPTGATRS